MIVKRKLAAHQIGACRSLPAQTIQERGKEELSGKGTKLLVKEHLASVGSGLANASGSGACAPAPLVRQSRSLRGVLAHVTAVEALVRAS